MLRKIRIEFELDVEDYGDEEDTPENAKALVQAMLDNDADWPWECDDGGPTIVVE